MQKVHENLNIAEKAGKKVFQCRCGNVLGPAGENYKNFALMNESPIQKAGPNINPYHIGGDIFVFREFCCPRCDILLGTEVAQKGSPLLWDLQPAI